MYPHGYPAAAAPAGYGYQPHPAAYQQLPPQAYGYGYGYGYPPQMPPFAAPGFPGYQYPGMPMPMMPTVAAPAVAAPGDDDAPPGEAAAAAPPIPDAAVMAGWNPLATAMLAPPPIVPAVAAELALIGGAATVDAAGPADAATAVLPASYMPAPHGATVEGGGAAAGSGAAAATDGMDEDVDDADDPECVYGDWRCRDCKNLNFSKRVQCSRCGGVRDGVRLALADDRPSEDAHKRHDDGLGSGGGGSSSGGGGIGDGARGSDRFKYAAGGMGFAAGHGGSGGVAGGSAVAPGGLVSVGRGAGRGIATASGRRDADDGHHGTVPGHASSSSMVIPPPPPPLPPLAMGAAAPVAAGGAAAAMPKEWHCVSCGNLNWARREACKMCGEPRPAHTNEVRTGAGGGFNERQERASSRRAGDDGHDSDEYDEFGRKKKRFRGAGGGRA